jgi:DnaK suppressor protein
MVTATATKAKQSNKIELPKGYKPTEKEEYMCAEHKEYFRLKLLNWKQELLEESNETLGHLKEENLNEPDITDRATVETETQLELRTRDRYRKLINKIDKALRRIEQDEYGFCEETGEPIGLGRLEARAIATLSIAAQEKHERQEKQYNDED